MSVDASTGDSFQCLGPEHLGKRCLVLIDGVESVPHSPCDVQVLAFSSDGVWVDLGLLGWRRAAKQRLLEVLSALLLLGLLAFHGCPQADDAQCELDNGSGCDDAGKPHIHAGELVECGGGLGAAICRCLNGGGEFIQSVERLLDTSAAIPFMRGEEAGTFSEEVLLGIGGFVHEAEATKVANAAQLQPEAQGEKPADWSELLSLDFAVREDVLRVALAFGFENGSVSFFYDELKRAFALEGLLEWFLEEGGGDA